MAKEIKSFQIGSFGEIYLLYTDGTMVQGELIHVPSENNKSDIVVEVVSEIKLPTN